MVKLERFNQLLFFLSLFVQFFWIYMNFKVKMMKIKRKKMEGEKEKKKDLVIVVQCCTQYTCNRIVEIISKALGIKVNGEDQNS